METYLRSENFLSTKSKWRLHIQYFDVMFRLSQTIPVDIVKRLFIPRLLLRFSTTVNNLFFRLSIMFFFYFFSVQFLAVKQWLDV